MTEAVDDFDNAPFESFTDIKKLGKLGITITEKIHGTNAQILISDDRTRIKAGSRNRWLTADHDNYGFARYVDENKEALIAFLGPGRHYGEWYGAGIGPGYDMKEKRFALFNTFRWLKAKEGGATFPPGVDVVPALYVGVYGVEIIADVMAKLKAGGSVLVPGYMKPEGIVVCINESRTLFKSVFDKEETGWDKKEASAPRPAVDEAFEAKVNELLQPIRLEKLLMKEETYITNYPTSLSTIVKDYVTDLVKETEGINEFVLAAAKKKAFAFVKEGVAKFTGQDQQA